jgi:hypothetical protein
MLVLLPRMEEMLMMLPGCFAFINRKLASLA